MAKIYKKKPSSLGETQFTRKKFRIVSSGLDWLALG